MRAKFALDPTNQDPRTLTPQTKTQQTKTQQTKTQQTKAQRTKTQQTSARNPELIAEHASETGQSPLWHPIEKQLYCTDIPAG